MCASRYARQLARARAQHVTLPRDAILPGTTRIKIGGGDGVEFMTRDNKSAEIKFIDRPVASRSFSPTGRNARPFIIEEAFVTLLPDVALESPKREARHRLVHAPFVRENAARDLSQRWNRN